MNELKFEHIIDKKQAYIALNSSAQSEQVLFPDKQLFCFE